MSGFISACAERMHGQDDYLDRDRIHLRMRGAYSIFFVVHILPLAPRAYGADNRFLTRHTSCLGSSPCIRGRRQMVYYCTCSCGLIPVHTGQALNPSRKSFRSMDKRFLLRRLPTIKSVCIISFRYIFADNTFWSKTDGCKIYLLFRMYPKPSNTSGHSPKRENPKMISDNSHKSRGVTGEHPSFDAKTKNGMSARCPKPILIP